MNTWTRQAGDRVKVRQALAALAAADPNLTKLLGWAVMIAWSDEARARQITAMADRTGREHLAAAARASVGKDITWTDREDDLGPAQVDLAQPSLPGYGRDIAYVDDGGLISA